MRSSYLQNAASLGLFGALAVSAAAAQEALTPPPDAAHRIAANVPDERTPDPGEHYPISNEWRHDLFFPAVRDLEGAFVGVGTDQCYTLAAVQRARWVWVVDFDPIVPLVHRLYEALVPASDTPAELVARFAAEQRQATAALVRARWGAGASPGAQSARILGVLRRNRERMHRYLTRLLTHRVEGSAASWLSDEKHYRRVQRLFRQGRIIARNGDLTNGQGALKAVARAAERLDVPVRVLYLSNAEQFFPYRKGFRENLRRLPVDDRSLVLRTFRERGITYPAGDRWHYMVQPIADLRQRVLGRDYRHSRQLVRDLMAGRGRHVGRKGVSTLDAQVPAQFVGWSRPRPTRATR